MIIKSEVNIPGSKEIKVWTKRRHTVPAHYLSIHELNTKIRNFKKEVSDRIGRDMESYFNIEYEVEVSHFEMFVHDSHAINTIEKILKNNQELCMWYFDGDLWIGYMEN